MRWFQQKRTLLRKYVLSASATSSMSMCMWGPISTAKTVRACKYPWRCESWYVSRTTHVHQLQDGVRLSGTAFRMCIIMPYLCHLAVREKSADEAFSS